MNMNRGFLQLIIIGVVVVAVIIGGTGMIFLTQKSENGNTKSIEDLEKSRQILELELELLKLEEANKQDKSVETAKNSQPDNSNQNKARVAELERKVADLNQQVEEQEQVKARQEIDVIEEVLVGTGKPGLSIAGLISKVDPAVVHIKTSGGTGSGFIILSDGLILTNNHVVEKDFIVTITLSDGSEYSGIITNRSEDFDIALVKIDKTGLQALVLGNSSAEILPQGSDVYAFGYPFGYSEQVSFKTGIVARRVTEDNQQYIESSADSKPGNSGGPLVNKFGEVIGINTLGIGRSISGVIVGETIKLALPINDIKTEIEILKNSQKVFSSEERRTAEEYRKFLVKYNEILSNRSKMLEAFNASLSTSANIAREKIKESKGYFELFKSNISYLFDKNNNAYPIDVPFTEYIENIFTTLSTFIQEMDSLYNIREQVLSAEEVNNVIAFNKSIKTQNSAVKGIDNTNATIDAQSKLIYEQADKYFTK